MADVPLAARMRPSSFEEFVGQTHLIGPGKALTRLLEGGHLPSIVLWGPAGTGKTTLAYLLADAVGGELVQLSAVSSGVGDARKVIEQEVTSKVTISDQEITDFFNANRAQFNLPEEAYHLGQIVVTPMRDPQVANRTGDDATTPQTATTKVQSLMTRLKEGAPFAQLAMDYSEDPESAPRGGDLGLVPMSRIKQAPPALREAALTTTPGSAKVVNQGGNYTIVFVVSREPAGQRDLSTPGVRERITSSLKAQREQLFRAAYLAAARTDADVVNYLARRVAESQGKSANP